MGCYTNYLISPPSRGFPILAAYYAIKLTGSHRPRIWVFPRGFFLTNTPRPWKINAKGFGDIPLPVPASSVTPGFGTVAGDIGDNDVDPATISGLSLSLSCDL